MGTLSFRVAATVIVDGMSLEIDEGSSPSVTFVGPTRSPQYFGIDELRWILDHGRDCLTDFNWGRAKVGKEPV